MKRFFAQTAVHSSAHPVLLLILFYHDIYQSGPPLTGSILFLINNIKKKTQKTKYHDTWRSPDVPEYLLFCQYSRTAGGGKATWTLHPHACLSIITYINDYNKSYQGY